MSGADIQIGLSAELIRELRKKVRFDSDVDIARFVEDAVRIYADLGSLVQGDGELIWRAGDGSERRVRLTAGGVGTGSRQGNSR